MMTSGMASAFFRLSRSSSRTCAVTWFCAACIMLSAMLPCVSDRRRPALPAGALRPLPPPLPRPPAFGDAFGDGLGRSALLWMRRVGSILPAGPEPRVVPVVDSCCHAF